MERARASAARVAAARAAAAAVLHSDANTTSASPPLEAAAAALVSAIISDPVAASVTAAAEAVGIAISGAPDVPGGDGGKRDSRVEPPVPFSGVQAAVGTNGAVGSLSAANWEVVAEPQEAPAGAELALPSQAQAEARAVNGSGATQGVEGAAPPPWGQAEVPPSTQAAAGTLGVTEPAASASAPPSPEMAKAFPPAEVAQAPLAAPRTHATEEGEPAGVAEGGYAEQAALSASAAASSPAVGGAAVMEPAMGVVLEAAAGGAPTVPDVLSAAGQLPGAAEIPAAGNSATDSREDVAEETPAAATTTVSAAISLSAAAATAAAAALPATSPTVAAPPSPSAVVTAQVAAAKPGLSAPPTPAGKRLTAAAAAEKNVFVKFWEFFKP